MEDGTFVRFGFVKNKRWYALFSWIIQWFERYTTGLSASHSFVQIFVVDNGESVIAESIWPVGRVAPVGKYFSKYELVEYYDFHINRPSSEMIKWCRENIEGKKYSLSQNVFIGAIGLIMKMFNWNNWDAEKYEFNGRQILNCTEAQVMFAAKFLGVIPTEGFDDFSVGEARDFIKSVWQLKGGKA